MLKTQKGFSLIELMVVVAIIGILSAVAVPQFQKFQRKAKQSEARANLSAIYTAEKVFLAEKGTYYPNLWAIGYEPEGEMLYTIGNRPTDGSSPVGDLPGMTAAPLRATHYYRSSLICGTTYAGGISPNCKALYNNSGITGAEVSANSFMMSAYTPLLNGTANNDVWTINHRKELVNTVNGAL